ncbi:E3 ubiquitin/ISG15 ligase TRIM25-like [Dendropsophus ebraccatus]|uniref:E3 ubiquitin/ISG15 ligase TRIM25-like n=1 Tax=Dendropsophus ebraccatus TaxID=150705 RepID=UPI0038322D5B
MMDDFRDELLCSICLDVFTIPVTLVCGHNFCWTCADQVLKRKVSGFYMCPQCRKRFRSRPVLNKNINLSNIAEQVRLEEKCPVRCTYCDIVIRATTTCLQCETSMCERHLQCHNRSVQHDLIDCIPTLEEKKCPLHNKIRGYFCAVEGTCICVSCCLSKEYRGLPVEPLNEAYEKKKKRLKKILELLHSTIKETEMKIQKLKKNIQKVQDKAEDAPFQAAMASKEQVLQHFTSQLQELHQANLNREYKIYQIEYLNRKVDPIDFLEELVVDTNDGQNTEEDTGIVQRYLPNITARAKKWWFPAQNPTDILLSIHTAANGIQVSYDRKTVICSVMATHPERSDRFEHNQVLSVKRFNSGRHYWDVLTSQPGDWMIGVCYLSMDRKGKKSFLGCNSKSWCLRRCGNEFWLQHNNVCLYLPHITSCHTVRVSLDYKAGHLSFHDIGSSIRHLHTYRIIFIEPVRAAFTLFSGWLQIRRPP